MDEDAWVSNPPLLVPVQCCLVGVVEVFERGAVVVVVVVAIVAPGSFPELLELSSLLCLFFFGVDDDAGASRCAAPLFRKRGGVCMRASRSNSTITRA